MLSKSLLQIYENFRYKQPFIEKKFFQLKDLIMNILQTKISEKKCFSRF